jgi:hypothetical protein
MKKFRIEFGGIVEVVADTEDEAMEKAAYQCLNDPITVMGLRLCEDQDDD